MKRWEYKMLTVAYPYEKHGIGIVKYVDGHELPDWKQRKWWVTTALNELGQEGWELVHIIWRSCGETAREAEDPVYILKRPVP